MTAHWEAQLTDISQKTGELSAIYVYTQSNVAGFSTFCGFHRITSSKSDFKRFKLTATKNEKDQVKKSEDLNAEN